MEPPIRVNNRPTYLKAPSSMIYNDLKKKKDLSKINDKNAGLIRGFTVYVTGRLSHGLQLNYLVLPHTLSMNHGTQ